VGHAAGYLTFSGFFSGPASSSSTRTFGFSLRRFAMTQPPAPAPTTMKSYVCAISVYLPACKGNLGELPQEGFKRLGVVKIRHVGDLAVAEAEVVHDIRLDRLVGVFGGASGDVRHDRALIAVDQNLTRHILERCIVRPHALHHVAQSR